MGGEKSLEDRPLAEHELKNEPNPLRREQIFNALSSMFCELFGVGEGTLDPQATFLEQGADSLFLLRASQEITKRFEVRLPFRLLLDDIANLETLAAHLDAKAPAGWQAEPAPSAVSGPAPIALVEAGPATSPLSTAETPATPVTPVSTSTGRTAPGISPQPAPGTQRPRLALAKLAKLAGGEPQQEGEGALERVMGRQLELMQQQLELLRGVPASLETGTLETGTLETGRVEAATQESAKAESSLPANLPETDHEEGAAALLSPSESAASGSTSSESTSRESTSQSQTPKRQAYVPFEPIDKNRVKGVEAEQKAAIGQLIERLDKRLYRSKELAASGREVLANNRGSAGFRSAWKDLIYPLMAERGDGARIWDVDDNEYIDLTMGFGSLLFGHAPEFQRQALHGAVSDGLQVGPENPQAVEAARLICQLTGAERATFTNSGTEAVMSALRLARTVTGRSKIAIFTGAYHGTFDGVLAKSLRRPDGTLEVVPTAPGVPQHMIDDILVLDFDDFGALDVIRQHAGELAAVLVEPRQSRRPEFDNREFLGQLKELTEASGIALVFDEVVTGFRVHPGGIQAIYGVQADLTTYGKAVANGLPIGVIAGQAKYLDAIDGGPWNFGDDSLPEAPTTFFAGTFFRHPLVMSGVISVLREIRDRGPDLQEGLARRTDSLAQRLNELFTARQLPIRVECFRSLFRFEYPTSLRYMDLFFYWLLEKGIYIWERRVCYLSAAHTEGDVDRVVAAVEEVVEEMQQVQLLPTAEPELPAGTGDSSSGKSYDLTEAQRELWALAQLGDDASVAYNLSAAVHLRGELETEALSQAVDQVIARHEALRTTFSAVGDLQHIHPATAVGLAMEELAAAGDGAGTSSCASSLITTLTTTLAAEARRPFDLTEGPLVRFRLLRVAPQHHVLAVTAHHIVVDGQSLGTVLHEVSVLYASGAATEAEAEIQLPAAARFLEFVEQQKADLARDGQQAEEHWLQQLSTPLPVLDLPLDRPRPPVQSFQGGRSTHTLGPDLAAGLEALARGAGATPFMVLLALVKVLLHRLTGQGDLVLGVPSAGQGFFDKPLVGHCLNVLAVRSRPAAEMPFLDYLREVKTALLDAQDYRAYPFSHLVRRLELRRDPSRPPLVSAMFNLDRGSQPLEMAGLEVDLEPNPTASAQFEIEWNATATAEGLEIECLYNSEILKGSTIRQWLGNLQALAAAVVEKPSVRLGKLRLLTEVERRRLEAWGQGSITGSPRLSFLERFRLQARRNPEAVAVVCANRQWTYRQLLEKSSRVARGLLAKGLEREEVVPLLADRSSEFLAGLLGILQAGGVYLPLDPGAPAERLSQVLAACGARVVISSANHRELLGEALGALAETDGKKPKRVSLEGLLKRALSTEAEPEPFTGRDGLAYVIYTSGSTGAPKGAMVEHRGLTNHLQAKISDLRLTAEDVIAQTAPQSFDISVWQFLAPLWLGGRVQVYDEATVYQPAELLRAVGRDEVTVVELVPALLRAALDGWKHEGTKPPELASCRWLMLTGEALPPSLSRAWQEVYPEIPVVNAYGPTECSDDVTHHILTVPRHTEGEALEDGRVPIGTPVDNVQLYVVGDDLELQLGQVPGELTVGGIAVGRGYLGNPAETAATFVPNPFSGETGDRLYRTGDRVRWLQEGALDFLERLDHQVKIRGFRIELGDVEAALERHPGVAHAVVLDRRGEAGEAYLAAYLVGIPFETSSGISASISVTPHEGASEATLETALEVAELRVFAEQHLPRYMVPASFTTLESFPTTTNGKVDRAALRTLSQFVEAPRPQREYTAPLEGKEQVLAEIWAEVLEVERVGRLDNFFDLGGDSILGIQIVARARQRGLHLHPVEMFRRQTVAELAAVADLGGEIAAEQGDVSGAVPETPILRWFREQSLEAPEHWNMSMLFRPRDTLDSGILGTAAEALVSHHDALRLRFPGSSASAEGMAHQAAHPGEAGAQSSFFLRVVDTHSLTDGEALEVLQREAAEAQGSFDLVTGPLFGLCLFQGGEPGSDRLLVLAHHAVVDIVSWGILLEDLESAYTQLALGEEVTLPAKTTSFRGWAQRLKEHANSKAIRAEMETWTKEIGTAPAAMPLDQPEGANDEASVRLFEISLDRETTEALVKQTPKAYGTQISDLLLTALGRAYEGWAPGEALLVDLEGHGREPLFEDVDLSRTVGWFTSLYPVRLEGAGLGDPGAAIGAVKERLRGLSNGGIGYGMLRYLADDKEVAKALEELPQADISFNFGGRSASPSEDAFLFSAEENRGPSQSPLNRRGHVVEIDGSISGGELHLYWRYSENLHHRSSIEALATAMVESLRELIEHCLSRHQQTFSPSDFPKARVASRDLDKLLNRLAPMEAR